MRELDKISQDYFVCLAMGARTYASTGELHSPNTVSKSPAAQVSQPPGCFHALPEHLDGTGAVTVPSCREYDVIVLLMLSSDLWSSRAHVVLCRLPARMVPA